MPDAAKDLPEDVAREVVKGMGAYIRATPAQELPGGLRRLRGFRPQALYRHRDELLGALEDDALRALIVEWLDDKPSLPRRQAELLRLAAQRPEGWEERLRGEGRDRAQRPRRSRVEILEDQLARERDKVRSAREEARKAKDEARAVRRMERETKSELARERDAVQKLLRDTERRLAEVERESRAEAAETERALRRARRDADRAVAAETELKRRVKEANREAAALRRRIDKLESDLDAARRKALPKRSTPRGSRAERRRALEVPKGLLEDAPETLDFWLSNGLVTLLVDGYNVSKAEGGYGGLTLEAQRGRVVDEVGRLARRKKVEATVVFDGSDIPPGTARPRRGSPKVEYSSPEESADDHLIGKLEGLPPDPVVVVTSDRELQDRARALGANIASSGQFLALIRRS